MKKIIYITLLASILFSCKNENESKKSSHEIDNKNDSSDNIIDKDSLIININENVSKTPIQEIVNKIDSSENIFDSNLRNSEDFTTFINHFIETVYSNINFDSLVYNSSSQIKEYLNGNHGGRFWNIGAACELHNIFNHHQYMPESGKNPDLNHLKIISNKSLVFDFCEDTKNPDAIYFREIESLPGHEDVSENKYIEAPKIYNDLQKILVEIVVDGTLIERLYFVDFSNKWFLLYIDDCGCDP